MPNNIKSENYCNAIVEAISYWLGYQSKIGREQLIHEASLRYPIVDTITANGIAINRIVLEKLHPIFSSKKIDLVIYAEDIEVPETEENDINLEIVFEFKLAKKTTADKYGEEHQRVFDDIVRLAYYNKWGKKDCYFLMCGKYSDFKNYFIGQVGNVETDKQGKGTVKPKFLNDESEEITEWKSAGLYSDLFDFAIGETKIQEFKADNEKWGLKPFHKNYKFQKGTDYSFLDSIKIKTTCIAITAYGLEKTRTGVGQVCILY